MKVNGQTVEGDVVPLRAVEGASACTVEVWF
jgi:hypothetical protein